MSISAVCFPDTQDNITDQRYEPDTERDHVVQDHLGDEPVREFGLLGLFEHKIVVDWQQMTR